MIPIRDHNPTSRPALIVPLLIAANVLMFIFVQPTLRGGSAQEREILQTRFLSCRAAIGYEVTHGELVREGLRDGSVEPDLLTRFVAASQDVDCPRKSVWASILTSMFLHGGWLHIAGNMLFMWVFGNNVEDRLGRLRFLAFYVVSGIAATYAQSFFDPSSTVPMIGASGAVAGILGAYLLMFPHARVTTLVIFFVITSVELPAILVLGLWFVLQLFQSVGSATGNVGGVAYMAHIGGFVAGMLLLLLFRPRRAPPARAYYD